MKLLTLLALVSIFSSNPKIEYSGRIDFSKTDAPRFSYSGVSIRACVEASLINATLNDERGENYFAVIIDRVYTGKLKTQKGKATYQLAQFSQQGTHEIELVKITEEMFGKTSFLGFSLNDGGAIIDICNSRQHTIEFIGNSITCGYGNEGALGQRFGAETENHYLSYAAMTVRNFGAKPIMVCKSGIGIYRNYGGPDNGSPDCMTNFYDRTFLYDAKPKHNFEQKPDLVCINLGTNDLSTQKFDSLLFINRYLELISQVQSHYSNTEIICLLGPMISGKSLKAMRSYIKQVVQKANLAEKGKVYFFEMSAQTGKYGMGTDYHPSIEQNIVNSIELTNFISKTKGWNVIPQIHYAKVSNNNQITLYANGNKVLFDESIINARIFVDGTETTPTNWLINEEEHTIHIILKEDISQANKIEMVGDAAFKKIMRCKIEK